MLGESRLKRDEVFLTTKIADTNLGKNRFMPSLRQSLDRLGTDYVDLLLIHWPSHRDAVPLADYMTALAETKAERPGPADRRLQLYHRTPRQEHRHPRSRRAGHQPGRDAPALP